MTIPLAVVLQKNATNQFSTLLSKLQTFESMSNMNHRVGPICFKKVKLGRGKDKVLVSVIRSIKYCLYSVHMEGKMLRKTAVEKFLGSKPDSTKHFFNLAEHVFYTLRS